MQGFTAVIFDMDGVITDTAVIHTEAWKEMFDAFLREYSQPEGMVPFDAVEDYRKFVDGKSRYEGVESFLESRGIQLPFGSPDDPPERKTVCGLGNRKELIFRKLLSEKGVAVFDSTMDFVNTVRNNGLKVSVASSSRNCRAVLESAGILHLFDSVVDGMDLAGLGLKSKPAPDIFLKAAEALMVPPDRAVVVEDAVSGVAAGKSGGFGFVLGIDREGDGAALRSAGADLVVSDLSMLQFELPVPGLLKINVNQG